MMSGKKSRAIYTTTLAAIIMVVFSSLSVVRAATLTVTNRNDSGVGSLRQAIADAAPDDTIEFAADVRGTIKLNSTLTITKNLTITGPGATQLRLSGQDSVEIFVVTTGLTLNLSNLTLTRGSIGSGGGAIFNSGTVNLSDCVLSDNHTTGGGGAIFNTNGTISITNCLFIGNTASGSGGGAIINLGIITIQNSIFSGNIHTGTDGGGAIYNDGGILTIENSSFTGSSTTREGGAIFNGGGTGDAQLTITNSSFSGNSATINGGVINSGCAVFACISSVTADLFVTNSTFTNNSTGGKGGRDLCQYCRRRWHHYHFQQPVLRECCQYRRQRRRGNCH